MRVIIAGAGIGGLTLAAALGRRGLQVLVLERAAALAPVGAGITVQANAMAALAHVDPGLAEAVTRAGAVPERADILDQRGRVLSSLPQGALRAALGQPAVCISRARLHEVLLAAAGRERVALGRAVRGHRDEGARVVATCEDGSEEAGDLLVGADGLRSAVRAQLVGDGEPRYAGYTSWRGVAPLVAGVREGQVSESWGRGARFGIVPIGHGEVYWFATADAPAGAREADEHAALAARFDGWHAPIPALVAATPRERLLRTDIADREPLPATRWTSGRVALLGDAAHPMTPNLGQGGCQAIEDAVVLDHLLASGAADVPAALAEYARRRAPRANRVVLEARRLGAVGQASSPPLTWARDLAMRATPVGMVTRRLVRSLRFAP